MPNARIGPDDKDDPFTSDMYAARCLYPIQSHWYMRQYNESGIGYIDSGAPIKIPFDRDRPTQMGLTGEFGEPEFYVKWKLIGKTIKRVKIPITAERVNRKGSPDMRLLFWLFVRELKKDIAA